MIHIIIRGPLGIGKTTVAKALAKKLNSEYVSIDNLLEKNSLDKIDKKLGKIPLKNFILVNKIISNMNNKSLVVDGNFYYREQIEDLINRLKNCKVFTLKAPVDVCISRNKERKKVYSELATRAVHNLVSCFDYGISINTKNKTKNEVVNEITKRI